MALAALTAALGVWGSRLVLPVAASLPGCAFKQWTGLSCATCGLTRCVLALGQGRWREAWHWHPAAVLVFLVLPLMAVWDLRRAWRNEAWPALPESSWARAGAWVMLGVVWALQAVRGI